METESPEEFRDRWLTLSVICGELEGAATGTPSGSMEWKSFIESESKFLLLEEVALYRGITQP